MLIILIEITLQVFHDNVFFPLDKVRRILHRFNGRKKFLCACFCFEGVCACLCFESEGGLN